MRNLAFIPGAVLCVSTSITCAQTSPVGQAARRTPRKSTSYSEDATYLKDCLNAISLKIDSIAKGESSSISDPCLQPLAKDGKASKPHTVPTKVQDQNLREETSVSVVGVTVPSILPLGDLSLKAARSQAAASASDADTFSANVQEDIKNAPTSSSNRSDYEDITKSAVAADAVLRAANLAVKASDNAAKATDPSVAVNYAKQAKSAADAAQSAFNLYLNFKESKDSTTCVVTGFANKTNPTYAFRSYLPLLSRRCSDAAVLAYYGVSKKATVANQAQYLYNAAQSTNQVSADLLTTTFSYGIQAVLAGTATAGSSQPASSGNVTGAAATPASTTDSVQTAVSKLEQGGDFNLRFAYPLAQYVGSKGHYSISFYPNLGFTINGLSSQATITESTDYIGNVPIEFYGELGSIPTAGTAAVLYADAKLGGDFIANSALAKSIGTGSTFYLGQYSAGISFANSVRVGFQYFQGPKQAYCVPNSTGCTAVTGSMSGVHLVVSFSPPSK